MHIKQSQAKKDVEKHKSALQKQILTHQRALDEITKSQDIERRKYDKFVAENQARIRGACEVQ